MNKKGIATFVSAVVMLLNIGNNCYADNDIILSVNKETHNSFTINAVFEKKQPYASLTVLYPDKALDAVDESSGENSVYTIKQFKDCSDFKVNLNLTENEPWGFYKVYVGAYGKEEYGEEWNKEFFFANSNLKQDVRNRVNTSSSSDLKDVLTEYSTTYPVLNINTIDFDVYSNEINNAMLNKNFTDTKSIEDAFNNAVVPLAANELSDLSSVGEFYGKYAGVMGITESYENDAISIFKNSLKNARPFLGFSDVKKTAIASIAVSKINSAPRGEIIGYIERYYEYLGIDITSQNYIKADKTSLAKSLFEKHFASTDEFLTKYKDSTKENSASFGGKPQGGGGGGGGGLKGDLIQYGNVAFPLEKDNVIDIKVSEPFSDVDSVPWANEAIEALRARGILNGDGEGKFNPSRYVLREEFIKMLLLTMFESVEEYDECVFEDVDKNAWYFPYVAYAVKNKIATGYSEKQFGTGQYVLREEMAVFINRALNSGGWKTEMLKESFSVKDLNEISPYAVEGVENLYKAEIVNGKYKDAFAPKDRATRAETAQILYNVIKRARKGE